MRYAIVIEKATVRQGINSPSHSKSRINPTEYNIFS